MYRRSHSLNYAVLWLEQERATAPLAGKLELGDDRLLLEGGVREARATLEIPYREVASVTVRHEARERLKGLPALRLERHDKHGIYLASLAGTGVLLEVAAYLNSLAVA